MSDHSSHLKNLSDLNPKKLEIIEFVISNCQGKPLELILPDLMAAGVPVVIGTDGIEEIVEMELTAEEEAQFAHSCDVIRGYLKKAEELLS